MSTRYQTVATVGLLALLTVSSYGLRLARPAPLPAEGALQAAARSLETFPVFIQSGEAWAQPVAIYASALGRGLIPGSSHPGRWAAAAVAALNVGLIFFIGRRLTGRYWMGVVAAMLLALTPAHFAYGRLGLEAIYPVPFVLGWLLCVLLLLERDRLLPAVAAGLCLGAGAYTSTAAPLTMAAYLALTVAVLWQQGQRGWRIHAGVLAGFAAPLVGMLAWFARYPETYPDTMGAWAIHAAHIRNPIDLARAFVNWNTLGTRASLYWDAFNPVYLFLPGGPPAGGVVRGAGVLLTPVALLVAAGAWHAGSRLAPPHRRLLLAAIVLAPLAASTFGERYAIDRSLAIVPLLIVLAAVGVASLLDSPRAEVRGAAIALLAAVPLQFWIFLRAYLA